jgi:hypothetical protein
MPRPRANVIMENTPRLFEIGTDYMMYSMIGSLSGYDFGSYPGGYVYHTSLDQPSMIKQGVIQDLGENLGILIRDILLGHIQTEKKIIDTDPLIYFDILGQYLMMYKQSTSIIIQRTLIVLIIGIGIILIISDHIWHRKRISSCNDSHCIYFHFKNPFEIRMISIIIYFISNIISAIVSLIVSLSFAWIMSTVRPVLWYGNSTLAIFLFSLTCSISFITIGYLFDIFHRFILRKSSHTSSEFNPNKINFDFEQHLSVLLVYSLLMIISIFSNNRSFYIILVWSIFICPMYLFLMIMEFILHWKQIYWNFFKEKYHWLFLPLIISLLPLAHTIEIISRLVRILIPLLVRRFSSESQLRGNLVICGVITVPTVFFVVIFLPILQRTKQFGRTLIVLLITFFITLVFAFMRQPFTKNHPNVFYAVHTSESIYKVEQLNNVPLISQSSSITVLTHGLALSSVLDQFSAKSGHEIHNRICFNSTNCIFDDTFNRKISIEHIKIESMTNFTNYTIIIRHVLSYNIQVSSFPSITFIVRNELNIPRTETIIDVILNSKLFTFKIYIKIKRCNITDSPFLLLFTRLIPNMVLIGDGHCQAIDDHSTLIFDLNPLSNQKK